MILGSILFVIAGILGLVLFVQHIMLLVKLFKHGGVGLGIPPIYDKRFLMGIHYLVLQQSRGLLSPMRLRGAH